MFKKKCHFLIPDSISLLEIVYFGLCLKKNFRLNRAYLFHRLAGSCPKLPVPSIIPHHDSMFLPIGVCWCMDFIPTPSCYLYNVILLFKENRTAYLRPDRLKFSTNWYDAVVRLKDFVKDSRGVELRLLFADCGSEWTNTHVGGNGNPASAKAKKLYIRSAWRAHSTLRPWCMSFRCCELCG